MSSCGHSNGGSGRRSGVAKRTSAAEFARRVTESRAPLNPIGRPSEPALAGDERGRGARGVKRRRGNVNAHRERRGREGRARRERDGGANYYHLAGRYRITHWRRARDDAPAALRGRSAPLQAPPTPGPRAIDPDAPYSAPHVARRTLHATRYTLLARADNMKL
ncbi:hypothetical protein RR46_06966 [Papilio xuthus]|uniref:Uncharacterized protein n=1 Tax=Papilio xuthus TaxID=66420 RepID=A0A194PSE4_PAPXU|nr:hypothetical protein RR46_06966 [Papilio xuthus]